MNRYWTLSGKPVARWPEPDTFELREAAIPTPGQGQALTRTIYVSLDPYQWGYKRRGVEAQGAPCHARTVSQVIESRMEGFAAGDFVFNTNGWAEYGLMGENIARPFYMIPRKLDPSQGRISLAVGVLGMLGLTAYAGMILLADSALVYQEWRRIVAKYNVLGIRVHDARLAAVMYVRGVSHILTLNVGDFSRFEGLTVLHPESI